MASVRALIGVLAAVLVVGGVAWWTRGGEPGAVARPAAGSAQREPKAPTSLATAAAEPETRAVAAVDPDPARAAPPPAPVDDAPSALRLLVVHSSRLRMPLDGVDVLALGVEPQGAWMLPRDDLRPLELLSSADAPLLLPASTSERWLWVRALGHAWTTLRVEPDDPDRIEVFVDMAGELEVSLEGWNPDWGGVLRLRRERGARGAECGEVPIARGGPTVVESLGEGAWLVSLERPGAKLGQVEVVVAAGERTSIALPVEAPPRGDELAPLAGWLVLPPELDAREVELRVEPRGDLARHQGDLRFDGPDLEREPAGLRWRAGAVRPGTYDLRSEPFGVRLALELGAGGDEAVRVVWPELHEVRVLVPRRDDAFELDPPRLDFTWHGELGADREELLAFETREGLYRTWLPVGQVVGQPSGTRYTGWVRGDVEPGVNELVLEPRATCALRITLRDGGRPLARGFSYWMAVQTRRIDTLEPVQPSSTQLDGATAEMRFFRDGLCALTLPPLDGYEPIEPTEVFLTPGRTLELDVHVERTP